MSIAPASLPGRWA
jgi:hypothetical protein